MQTYLKYIFNNHEIFYAQLQTLKISDLDYKSFDLYNLYDYSRNVRVHSFILDQNLKKY